MRLAIMQPYFFPYLGYFQLLAAADTFILYDNVNYIRKGWIHRNRVRVKGRDPIYCAAPVRGASSFMKIRDVQVDHTARWPGAFLDLVAFNYKKSPYYHEVFPVIECAVTCEATHLTTVNRHALTAVADYLELRTTITSDVTRYEPFEDAVRDEHSTLIAELRETMHVADIKTLRVLHICRGEGAEMYLNPIGGQALYHPEPFARNGMALRFVQPRFTPYRQFGAPFIPGLSIIDVLMHCGREGTQRLLRDYILV